MIITVTPNPLLNLICDQDVDGKAINRVSQLTAQAEGKGINVARVLSRWGSEVRAMGFAGGPSGAWFSSIT